MARRVNEEEFATRRNEILDAAQQLIYTRGYEQMTIQDILALTGISKGAFYHYYRSKAELLEALIDRMRAQSEHLLTPILADPGLTALEKLQFFFGTVARWKTARKELLLALLQVWYTDDNVLVREKLRMNAFHQVVPLITHIICQGVREGVMTTAYPERVAEVVMALAFSLSESTVALALAAVEGRPGNIEQARTTMLMYTNAIERVLGITPGTLVLMDEPVLKAWFE